MSTKSFISAEEHLAKFGVTVEQAFDFIFANTENAELIFEVADRFLVTNNFLSEITNHSIDTVRDYFSINGIDSSKLDYASRVINFDLDTLEHLVGFNENAGLLSNDTLRDAVKPLLNFPLGYEPTFEPFSILDDDGIFDAEELGVGHLSNVPANGSSLESIFYGSLINSFNAVDETELETFNSIRGDINPDNAQIMLEILSESPESSIWPEEQLAGLVIDEAVSTINGFWTSGNDFGGVLDLSFLGLSIA